MAGEYKGYPSRRAYENQRVQALGYANYSQFTTIKKTDAYRDLLHVGAMRRGVTDKYMTNTATAPGREYAQRFGALVRSGSWDPATGSIRRSSAQLRAFFNFVGMRNANPEIWENYLGRVEA